VSRLDRIVRRNAWRGSDRRWRVWLEEQRIKRQRRRSASGGIQLVLW